MLGLLIGAGVLGLIIAAMEQGEFPGWGKMIVCALAAVIPAIALNSALPPEFFFVGPLAGAACAAAAIWLTCGMSIQRSCIAAGIYFAFQIVLSLVLYMMFK